MLTAENWARQIFIGLSSELYKQWRKDPGLWAIPFTTFVAGGITMTRSGWQGSGEWNGDSGTVSLTGYSAQCATGNSVSNIGGSAIAIGQ